MLTCLHYMIYIDDRKPELAIFFFIDCLKLLFFDYNSKVFFILQSVSFARFIVFTSQHNSFKFGKNVYLSYLRRMSCNVPLMQTVTVMSYSRNCLLHLFIQEWI